MHSHLDSRKGWVVNDMSWLLYCWVRDLVSLVQEAQWASRSVWIGMENSGPTRVCGLDCPACSKLLCWLLLGAE